jgi:hypothetical protein
VEFSDGVEGADLHLEVSHLGFTKDFSLEELLKTILAVIEDDTRAKSTLIDLSAELVLSISHQKTREFVLCKLLEDYSLWRNLSQ